jgi:hypothetical protein
MSSSIFSPRFVPNSDLYCEANGPFRPVPGAKRRLRRSRNVLEIPKRSEQYGRRRNQTAGGRNQTETLRFVTPRTGGSCDDDDDQFTGHEENYAGSKNTRDA